MEPRACDSVEGKSPNPTLGVWHWRGLSCLVFLMAPSPGLLLSPLCPPAPGIFPNSTSGAPFLLPSPASHTPALGFLRYTRLDQATTSKWFSGLSLQHQGEVSQRLPDLCLSTSISHYHLPSQGRGQPHLHPHLCTQCCSCSRFLATPPQAHVAPLRQAPVHRCLLFPPS